MFAELHCHTDRGSNVRFRDSMVKTSSAINKAIELGHKGLAITDHESLCAHIQALNHMQKLREKQGEALDFTLILGNEIYLIDEASQQNTDKFYHFLLLAKDAVGHAQLRELSTLAWGRAYTHKNIMRPNTFYSDIERIVGNDKGHLIACTACLGGQLAHAVETNNTKEAVAFCAWCSSTFGAENFFVEIQCGVDEKQVDFNQRIVRFCKHFGYRWVITNDVHYLTGDRRKLHENFLNAQKDSDREFGDFYENTYFKDEAEMRQRLDYLDEADITQGFANTVAIASMCKDAGDYDLFHPTEVPERKLPSFKPQRILSESETVPYITKYYDSPFEQDQWLMNQIEQGIKRLGVTVTDVELERINYELEQMWLISEKKNIRISSYYNLVQYIVDIMWDDTKGNSLVGVARGSVGGWYIAYLMDITQLNPLKVGTIPWRHLHASRPELPDIDIDSEASKRPQIFQALKNEFGEERCLNIITFKTESAKSAIQTAARGLGIDVDVAREVSALVPVERGKSWSIHDCLYGNAEEGRAPIREFIEKIKQIDGWLETTLEIEDLVCGRGIHASGFFIFDRPYLERTAMMRAPNGMAVTCWDMNECEQCGALKVDELTTEAEDKLRHCMDYLLADGLIQWQGSLRATYNKYLHPDVLDYDTVEMWDLAADGKITDLFQMMTDVGGQAIKRIRPKTLKELSLTNSVMRLMANEDGSPLDRFATFKANPKLWYEEMAKAGLTKEETQALEKHLSTNYGCSIEQEDIMLLVMDEHVSAFTMEEANSLRKAVAKKKKELAEKNRKYFFEKGKSNHTRQTMLDYVWGKMIMPQLGYSFSRNHTLPYSAIALQEMNLFYHQPSIYWQCACLTVNASADEENQSNSSTNYGKIAKAIGNMQQQGVVVALPDINTASYGFKPDKEQDRIIFGLKGISGVGDELATAIVANRKYNHIEGFCNRVEVGAAQLITLVKAGAFDTLYPNVGRERIMEFALDYLARQNVEAKTSLGLRNLKAAQNMDGFIPSEFEFPCRLNDFRAYIKQSQFLVEKGNAKLDRAALAFFEGELQTILKEGVEYDFQDDDVIIHLNKFEKVYKQVVTPLKDWLALPETLQRFNELQEQQYRDALMDKYCKGTIPKWEMEALSFYYTEHELAHVNTSLYGIRDFNELPEEPVVVDQLERKSKLPDGSTVTSYVNRYELTRIAGTVLDRDKNKHSITLLTTTGVVVVKMYDGAFANYNKQISQVFADGTKKVVEKPWFSRGNKILVSGFRRGDTFFPRKYRESVYQHTIALITDVFQDGSLGLQTERVKV